MKVTVQPSILKGKVQAPSSKSIFQRLVVAGLLAEGKTVIQNESFCDDAVSAMSMAVGLGAQITIADQGVEIIGGYDPVETTINAGESGLGIRLFTALTALHTEKITIEGKGSLLLRPMDQFEEILSQVGVEVKSNKGFLPIEIKGKMKGGTIKLDGSMSSQFLSGLLMALPVCKEDSIIEVSNLKSIPYVDMTLKVLEEFGIKISHSNYETFTILGNQKYLAKTIYCPGDWSGAAGLFVSAAVSAEDTIEINGLFSDYYQADQKILEVMNSIGIEIKQNGKTYVVKSGDFNGFTFDATHCPDLFPVLSALASFAKTPSVILGVHRLKHKESDRGIAIQTELAKAGIKVIIEEDRMTIYPSEVQSCVIHSHHDHRIAMMATILGLGGKARITIEDAECIDKSYSDYYQDLVSLGGKID